MMHRSDAYLLFSRFMIAAIREIADIASLGPLSAPTHSFLHMKRGKLHEDRHS
jgi:hypothetical protein